MREVDRFSHLQNDLKALVQDRKARYTWQEIVPHLPRQTNKKYKKTGEQVRMVRHPVCLAAVEWPVDAGSLVLDSMQTSIQGAGKFFASTSQNVRYTVINQK